VLGKNGLNLGLVVGVGDEQGQVSLHVSFVQVKHTVELLPELFLEGCGGTFVELNGVEAEGAHNSHGGLEASIVLHVVELAGAGHDVNIEGGGAVHANELAESISVFGDDLSSVNKGSEGEAEGVLTVVLPDSLEVGLSGEAGCLLVGEDEVLLLDNLGGELSHGFPLSLEAFATLRGGGINTEVDVLVLVGVGERVESSIHFTLVVVLEEVTTVSPP